MSVSGFHREMIENQCFVQVGPDRIEKILSKNQVDALRERWSIDLRSEDININPDISQSSSMADPTLDEANQRRLPKKRLLKSFHLEEATSTIENRTDKEFNSQGTKGY